MGGAARGCGGYDVPPLLQYVLRRGYNAIYTVGLLYTKEMLIAPFLLSFIFRCRNVFWSYWHPKLTNLDYYLVLEPVMQ